MKIMKKIYLVLVFALGFLSTVNAQTNITSSGMSIQGIARDETNAAIANIDQLALVFTVYYLGTGNSEQLILTKTANVRTDNFGVFSYVLDIDQLQYNQISTQSAYLKVVQGSVVFSNEKLQAVPYAIYAQNGVPTGSIMPFIGTVAPNGWLLCNGSTFADNANTANLKALLGSTTTPDLRAMFLRGTGDGNGKSGPALKVVQNESTLAHSHSITSLKVSREGDHNHSANSLDYNRALKYDGTGTGQGFDNNTGGGVEPNISSSRAIPTDGGHQHSASGSTENSGGTEIRPINYGVNYIIKI